MARSILVVTSVLLGCTHHILVGSEIFEGIRLVESWLALYCLLVERNLLVALVEFILEHADAVVVDIDLIRIEFDETGYIAAVYQIVVYLSMLLRDAAEAVHERYAGISHSHFSLFVLLSSSDHRVLCDHGLTFLRTRI